MAGRTETTLLASSQLLLNKGRFLHLNVPISATESLHHYKVCSPSLRFKPRSMMMVLLDFVVAGPVVRGYTVKIALDSQTMYYLCI